MDFDIPEYGKILVILIRGHGEIPIFNYSPSKQVNTLLQETTFDSSPYVKNLIAITNALNGEMCYGSFHLSHTVEKYSEILKQLYDKELNTENGIRTIKDFMKYVFGSGFKPKILNDVNISYLGREGGLQINLLENKTINKVYTPLFARNHTTQTEYVETTQPIGGLNLLLDKGIDGKTRNEIKALLEILTAQMYSLQDGGISKKNILVSLKKYDIDFLYLVDLTCSVYSNIILSKDPDGNDVFRREQLLDQKILTNAYEKKKLRGGKKDKKNKKYKNKNKSKKYQKKRNHNKLSIRNRNRNNQ